MTSRSLFGAGHQGARREALAARIGFIRRDEIPGDFAFSQGRLVGKRRNRIKRYLDACEDSQIAKLAEGSRRTVIFYQYEVRSGWIGPIATLAEEFPRHLAALAFELDRGLS